MPELPEVETMVRGLRPALQGRVLARVVVQDPFLLQGCTAATLARRGRMAPVGEVRRRGKWVVIALGDRRGIIVIQPRMTGSFWRVDPPRPEHIRMRFDLHGTPEMIWFCDTRRLGKIALYPDEAAAEGAFARSHGPDALEITRDQLREALRRTRRGIKPTLLDQKVLAGVGNIYADEILHRAGLHPERPSHELAVAEVDRLHAAIRPILETAIAAEGSSFDAAYRTVEGDAGGYLAISAVHRRAGQPCRACGQAIVKTRIAGLIGRPTYFCPHCQPVRPPRKGSPAVRKTRDRVS